MSNNKKRSIVRIHKKLPISKSDTQKNVLLAIILYMVEWQKLERRITASVGKDTWGGEVSPVPGGGSHMAILKTTWKIY